MCTWHDRYRQYIANIGWAMCIGYDWCELSKINISWPMSLVISWRRFLEAHMPCMMCYVVSKCQCCLDDKNTAQHMRASLGWLFLFLATSLAYHTLARDYCPFHWLMSMSLAKCTHTMYDACSPWLMPPIFGWHRFPHFICHVWCMVHLQI